MDNKIQYSFIDNDRVILSGSFKDKTQSKTYWEDLRIFQNPAIRISFNGTEKVFPFVRVGNGYGSQGKIGNQFFEFSLIRLKNERSKLRLMITVSTNQKKWEVA